MQDDQTIEVEKYEIIYRDIDGEGNKLKIIAGVKIPYFIDL